MLLGHIGIGLAGKSVERKLPLWTLLIAVMIPDLMSAVFAIAGLKDDSAFWSHSLLMTLLYCLVSALIIYLIYKSFPSVLMFSGLILSHWICDFISWPLEAIGLTNEIIIFSKHSTYGMGLYKEIPVALVIEFSLLALGLGLYLYKRHKNNT